MGNAFSCFMSPPRTVRSPERQELFDKLEGDLAYAQGRALAAMKEAGEWGKKQAALEFALEAMKKAE